MTQLAWTLEGADGVWARVRSTDYDGLLGMLVKADVMTDQQARDFLDAGDGEASFVNPKTGATETYATMWDGPRVTLYRRIAPSYE